MIREPLDSARAHIDAILPHNPTIRVGRRGRESDVVLAYYQTPTINPEASMHVIDYASQVIENRVPYQRSLCWPDENGVLHFGHPAQGQPFILTASNDTPTRFFELTDRFRKPGGLEDALFFKASLSRLLVTTPLATPQNIRSAIRIVNEDQVPIQWDYELEYQEVSPGKYRITFYSREKFVQEAPIWVQYPADSGSSMPIWVSEPLYFGSIIENEDLGQPGPSYKLGPRPNGSGYIVTVEDKAEIIDEYGTAFIWRIAGRKDGLRVHTGWFPGWTYAEESPKELEQLTLQQILNREHPGAVLEGIEQRKLWGGSINVYQGRQDRPFASTDRKLFSGNIPEGKDLIQIPHEADIYLSCYEEIAESDVWWKVTARVKMLNVDPSERNPYGPGYGNGIWEVRGAGGYYREIVDWEHRSVWEGFYDGGLHFYGQFPRRDWIEAKIGIWVPYDVVISPKVANDDGLSVYVNEKWVWGQGSTGYYKFLKGNFYDFHHARIPLKKGYNLLRMVVRDRGDKFLATDRTGLTWDRALHRALNDAGLNGMYWIGKGPEPEVIHYTDVQEGTEKIRWREDPKIITPKPYEWPNFEWRFVDLQAGDFPYLRATRLDDFPDTGRFSLEIEAPLRHPVGKNHVFPVRITREQGKIRLASFPDLLKDLGLEGTPQNVENITYIEATSSKEEVAVRFAWSSNPLDPQAARYFTGHDGSSRISVKEIRQHSNPTGWLLAWTDIPAVRISKRFAFQTKDNSRIFVLESKERRSPDSHFGSWNPYIRPGRVVRRLRAPNSTGSDRYKNIPVHETFTASYLLWTYDVPEYFSLDFHPAPPFRRIKADPVSINTNGRIVLPHRELSFDPSPVIKGIDPSLIEWVSFHSGTIKLKSLPALNQPLRVEYGAREDAFPYLGYKREDGLFVPLNLNPSRYHRYASNKSGEILGHLDPAGEPIVFQEGSSLLGKTITLYVLPSRVQSLSFEDYSENTFDAFDSPSAIRPESTGVVVEDGVLKLQSGQTSGTAYLARWQTKRPVRRARIYTAGEKKYPGDSIHYEIWNGVKWVEAAKGQYVLFHDDLQEVRVRIHITSPNGTALIEEIGIEAIGVIHNNEEIATWSDSIFHTTLPPNELLKLDPLAMPLAVISIGVHASPSDLIVIDARSRGGGLVEPLQGVSRDELGGYWDIGYWDGKAHLENGIIVVELPVSILKEYGGRFTHDEVVSHLNRHLAYGHMAIVRYKGEDGSWINRQT